MQCKNFEKRQAAPKPMTEREFVIQYVLNRALTQDSLDGRGAANEARRAWEVVGLCKSN
jgi:hypothetical protein